ncbi:hypothetical protein MBRA1_001098 [Malassezia brasiliensis]|uniref:Uncharacterized protein n=1 Tax=Malassezia brasiliensis TaxID=1821822 RepID=A0AAF0DR52_9BASI|nr:hypothetical protein MBRA1_001098 [Malassezia brasiliensis]
MEPFSVRNVSYLRISAHTILITVLYLDQRHVRWLNEKPELWQRAVYELLRPRMRSLLVQALQDPSHTAEPESKSLQFPSGTVPLDDEEAANAHIPSRTQPSEPAVKEEPIDDEGPLFIPASDDEGSVRAPSPASDEDIKVKPKVRVSYAGFSVFGRELVCVLEPTAEAIAANPDLFNVKDDAARREQRQLSEHARVAFETPAPTQRSQRQYGRGESMRNASRQPTPLFRGMTPATEDGF